MSFTYWFALVTAIGGIIALFCWGVSTLIRAHDYISSQWDDGDD